MCVCWPARHVRPIAGVCVCVCVRAGYKTPFKCLCGDAAAVAPRETANSGTITCRLAVRVQTATLRGTFPLNSFNNTQRAGGGPQRSGLQSERGDLAGTILAAGSLKAPFPSSASHSFALLLPRSFSVPSIIHLHLQMGPRHRTPPSFSFAWHSQCFFLQQIKTVLLFSTCCHLQREKSF